MPEDDIMAAARKLSGEGSDRDRVASFLKDVPNQPQNAPWIKNATGVPAGGVENPDVLRADIAAASYNKSTGSKADIVKSRR